MQLFDIESGTSTSQIVSGGAVSVRLPEAPIRYYWHGWQSWSLAAWIDVTRVIPVPKPHILHPLQLDPVHAFHPRPRGSWLGAAQMLDGTVVLLGSLAMDAHVELHGGELRGYYDGSGGEWLIATGDEKTVFSDYAQKLVQRFGPRSSTPAPRVWCSWYSMYGRIDEQSLSGVFKDLGDLPFDVVQVDDGWQQRVGDWDPNPKFSSGMQTLQQKITATGRMAGIWLAPFIAVKSSRLFREHRDWFLRDAHGRLVSAGFNWGEQVYALDTTHALVVQWLKGLMQKMRAWGYRYLKLDFLYAGALPGVRHANIPREQAYRQTLQVLRDAMGDDAYFLACGAPIVPSLGVCDALRIGPDVAAKWESRRDAVLLHNPAIPGTRNAIRTTMSRLWLMQAMQLDPDVAYFSPIGCDLTPEQRQLLQGLSLICGFKATSDLPGWLTESETEQLRQFLLATPKVEQTGARSFRIEERELDYGTAIEMTDPPSRWDAVQSAVFGWFSNQSWALRINDRFTKWVTRRTVRKGTSRRA